MFAGPGDDGADTRAEAKSLAFRYGAAGNFADEIGRPEDVDLLALSLRAGDRVELQLASTSTGEFPFYGVLRAFGETSAVDASVEHRLTFTAAAAGTFHVGVSGFGNDQYDPDQYNESLFGFTGSYRLDYTITAGTPGSDPTDPPEDDTPEDSVDDTPPTNDPPEPELPTVPPSPVLPDETLSEGELVMSAEVDTYPITVATASWFEARVLDASSNTADVTLTLTDAAGNTMATSASDAARLTQHLAPGNYALTVQSSHAPFSYQLGTRLIAATSPLEDLLSGDGVSAFATGDFTGDGVLDAVIANDLESTLTFLVGLGDGTFAPQTPHVLNNAPTNLLAADVTGDGRLDLVVAHRDGDRLSLLESGTNGWFGAVRGITVGAQVRDLAVDDLDGDGQLDLAVVVRASPAIVVVTNVRETTPQTRNIPLSSEAVAITTGDFNGDARQDLAVALRSANTVAVLEQALDGTFGLQLVEVSGEPNDVAVGDFDTDGDVDLAVGLANDGNVALLRREASGAYSVTPIVVDVDRAVSSAGSDFRTVLHAADFSGDRILDLAVANTFAREVTVLLGGDVQPLSVANQVLVSRSIVALDAADVNHDGRLDLLAANNDPEQAGVAVRLGRGDGSFQQANRLSVGVDPHALLSVDLNSDGRVDLVSSSYAGLSIQLGVGDGAFATPTRIAVEQPHGLVSGDLNRDGRPDLAATLPFDGLNVGSRIAVWLGLGDGSFRDATFYNVGELPLDIVAADFNGDGVLDLATANNASNSVTVLLGSGDGSFGNTATINTGTQPSAIVAADMNGDGRFDLAVANEASDTISLFFGDGAGQFTLGQTLATGEAPIDLLAADLDGDGRVDLANANHADDALTVLFQETSGAFTTTTISVGAGPRALALVSESAGKVRLGVTLDKEDQVMLLEYVGERRFTRSAAYTTGRTPIALVASDLNQDGRADLATLNAFSNDVTLLFAAADGTFYESSMTADAMTDATPTFADLTADGVLDALVVRQSGQVLLRAGRAGGGGLFDAPIVINPGRPALAATAIRTEQGEWVATLDRNESRLSFYRWQNGNVELVNALPLDGTPIRLAAGDLNGDGLDDLAIADAMSGQITVLFATGDGSWQQTSIASGAESPSQLAILDADGRNGADLVLADSARGDIRVFLNNGAGQFNAPLVYRAGLGPYQIEPMANANLAALRALAVDSSSAQHSLEGTTGFTFGDFDGDALPDLLVLNPGSNTLALLTGAGANGFGAPQVLPTGDRPSAAAVGDFNRDGRADLAVLLDGEARIAVYLGDGQGGFVPSGTYAAANLPRGLAALDVDGDSLVDLVIGNAFGDLLTFRGHGDGTFGNFLRAGSDVPLAVADLDGDGIPEVIVANESLDRLSVQQTNGTQLADGALTATQIFERQRAQGLLAPGAVEMADLNGDGAADMIVANRGGNEILVYLGNGDGTFADARSFHAGTNPTGITIHDVNGDGRLDLVIANAGSNDVSVLLNDSAQLLMPGPRLNVGSAPVATEAGDFNQDGLTDLLVANSGADNVSLLFGIGGGFFNDQTPLLFPTGADPRSLLVGQFDGRAGADLVSVNAGNGTLTFYSNFLSGALGATTIATGGLRPTSAVARDFNSDGRLDLVVANNASGSLALVLGFDGGLTLGSVLAELGFDHPSSLELIDFGGEEGLRLLVSHEGDEQPHLFTPKDFLPRENAPRVSPLGPGSGFLVTFLQAGLRVLASSIVTLPAVSPAAARFFQLFLGEDAEVADAGHADLSDAEASIFFGGMQRAAELFLDGLEIALDGAVASWNAVLDVRTDKAEWLAGAGKLADVLFLDTNAVSDIQQGAALAALATNVAEKLNAQAADAILTELETIAPETTHAADATELSPGMLPDEPSNPMPTPRGDAPVRQAALQEEIQQLPPRRERIELTTDAETAPWTWRAWATAVALGSVALGAGGYAARRYGRRRAIEPLNEASA